MAEFPCHATTIVNYVPRKKKTLKKKKMEQSLIHSILCNTHFIEMLYQGYTITSSEHKTISKRTRNHHDYPPPPPPLLPQFAITQSL